MRTATPPDVPGLISGGRARRRRRHAAWAAAGALAVVIAAGGGYGVLQSIGDGDASSRIARQPTPQPLPDRPESVALDPGTYVVSGHSDYVVAPYTITVPTGWVAQHGVDVGKRPGEATDAPGDVLVEPFVLDHIRLTGDACRGKGTLGAPQESTAGLVAGLRAQGSGLRVSDPVADTVGGLPATRIDLDYPRTHPLADCRLSTMDGVEPGVLQVWSGYFVLFPAESASVYVVDVAGRSQLFVTRTSDDASAADRAELQSLLDSITFRTGAD